jgi:hypothetical protein
MYRIENTIYKRLCAFDLGLTGFLSGKKPGWEGYAFLP